MSPQTLEFASPSAHGTPVYLTVWDLLPPSRWASFAYNCGLGVLHTDVWLPDAATEWGYGGHDVASVTGIFALPRDGETGRPDDGLSRLGPRKIPAPGPSPLPEARYVGSWFIGYAGAPEVSHTQAEQASQSSDTGATPCIPAGSRLDRPNKETGRWAAPQSGWNAYLEPRVGEADASTGSGGRNRSARHRGARARSLAWSLKVIMEMKEDPQYYGTNYDLLARNCNHFSDALLQRLTGARLPGWINRAAWVSQRAPDAALSSQLARS
ncbi:Uncharacterized conserved protein [Ceraceosorus bombacis]|uniref:Uncharacterized conserved protein n=1 Tax=Ceraceosorus bombacis TaxID=401625 RepID=A0A0P1BR20_9BASI|nr:Uncharacterized conserved protein [Ceraceosorus bombacis]